MTNPNEAITLRAQEILDEEIAKLEGVIRKRLVGVADECALLLLKQYEIQSMQNHILITVKKEHLHVQ